MRDLLLSLVVGLVGAVVLHIVIVLGVPLVSVRDAFSRVEALGAPGIFYSLANEPSDAGLYNADPFLRSAVCRFSVADAPVAITAGGDMPFWSLSIFDRRGNEVYSMNDRTAVERQVDVTVASPVQIIALRRASPDALTRSIMIEMPNGAEQGYAVLRTDLSDATWEPLAREFLAGARCDPLSGS